MKFDFFFNCCFGTWYVGTAMVCLQNLRKTLRYGGRKNVPSIEEITAITAGRNSKRQMYRLPGGTERVINTKSTSVVQVSCSFYYYFLKIIIVPNFIELLTLKGHNRRDWLGN